MTNIQQLNYKIPRSSDVVKTLITPCFFNDLSSDHKEQFNFNARAKYSTSFGSGQTSFALGRNFSNSEEDIKFIFEKIRDLATSNDFSFKPDFLIISALYFSTSFNKNSGANNGNLVKKIKFLVLPSSEISAEITMFASITSPIQDLDKSDLYLLCKEAFIFFPISKASSLVSLDFLTIELRSASCEIFSRIDSLATSDQLISSNSSIWFFKSSGIDKVIVGIFCPKIFNLFNIFNTLKVFKSFGGLK